MKKRTKKKYRKYKRNSNSLMKSNYLVVLIVIIMIGIAGVFIKLGMDFDKNLTPLYSYTVEKSDYYEVLLNPNTFYTTKTLPSGRYYASKSVNAFAINFLYHFQGKNNTNLEYHYNITADLVGTVDTSDHQGKEVWNRTFTLLDNQNNRLENIDEFSVDESMNIDYEYYNNLVRSYETTYGISIDSVLKIHFNISYQINATNVEMNTENVDDYIELDIPITNTVTEASENYENAMTRDILPEIDSIKNARTFYYILAGALILGAVSTIVITIRKNTKVKTPEEMYEHNMNRILKYYGDLIVAVTNEPNIENLKIMNITTLSDLIDVAEQNKTNIIYFETIQNKESNLYVIVGNYVYIYIVTSNELN